MQEPTLDFWRGYGEDFTWISEMKRNVRALYRSFKFKRLLKIKRNGDKHSIYVILGNKDVKLLADYKRLRITAIRNIELIRGYSGNGELNNVLSVKMKLADGREIKVEEDNETWTFKGAKQLLKALGAETAEV